MSRGVSRREFLCTCACGAAAASLGACSHVPVVRSRGPTLELSKDAFADAGMVLVEVAGRNTPLLLVRHVRGVVALSTECTHRGCQTYVRRRSLVCPCHGSRFDLHGRVLEGPASRPLELFTVEDRGSSVRIEWEAT